MDRFKLVSNYKPSGDQPQAIKTLVDGINNGYDFQTLLGVTGSGKTFTMANIIENVNKPTLVLAHNKTLAGQLYSEFKEFFPNNAVEYFVSYYDYYRPEAYIPNSDTFIEKDAQINEEIDKLRHSATCALAERKDVIVVASVSCIYSLGDPNEYKEAMISLRQGQNISRDDLIKRLVAIRYERNDIDFKRNKFRVRGDIVEVFPVMSNEKAIRVEFFGDEIDRICEIDHLTGKVISTLQHTIIFPATHYAISRENIQTAIKDIDEELSERIEYFKAHGKHIEAQRIEERTHYDMEMLLETGFCSGIENYSRVLSRRPKGSTPYTLLDHFPKDFLLIVDESHVTIPQVNAMYFGDRSRKDNLVNFGFRLPSAYDNRPLNFNEFLDKLNQTIFVSATPSNFERSHSKQIAEQIIRPTGLLDPEIDVKPIDGQMDDLISEINIRTPKGEKILITALTKKMAEDLTEYLEGYNIRVKYMHHETDTIKRMEIIREFRSNEFDVLVGINLLREGLDIPEVTLVAILDADKQGFLRSETALIQTIGRTARNSNGRVIMYADTVTSAMESAIKETYRRRNIQLQYNMEHGIVPKTIIKSVRDIPKITNNVSQDAPSTEDILKSISQLEKEMKQAQNILDFEYAIYCRDKIKELKNKIE
ncbi:MAG: excinuclease ABC subunit UvrB [Ruminococcus sp.]|nr:excinuclease ABC subunit UvrB [Ruminococcus sp.]